MGSSKVSKFRFRSLFRLGEICLFVVRGAYSHLPSVGLSVISPQTAYGLSHRLASFCHIAT